MNSHHYVAFTLSSDLEIAVPSKNDKITSQFVLVKTWAIRGLRYRRVLDQIKNLEKLPAS
jgi:hypothetical protein